MSTKKPISFSDLRINAPAQAPEPRPVPAAPVPAPAEVPAAAPRARTPAGPAKREVKASKPGKTIPVRLTQEQWYEAKEFAMRQDESLQELFIKGLNTLRAAKGLPPLTGTRM